MRTLHSCCTCISIPSVPVFGQRFICPHPAGEPGRIYKTKKTCKSRQSGLYHVLSHNVSRYFTTGNERCRDQGLLQRDVAFSQEIPRQAQEALEHTSRTKHHRVFVRGYGVLLFGRVSVGNVCPAWMEHQRGPDGIEIAGDMRDVLSHSISLEKPYQAALINLK